MSLINEALQRARQESRRRQALAKGLPLTPPPRSVPHRSWLTAAVVALALALLVSLVAIARLARNEPEASAHVATSAERIDVPQGEGQAAEPIATQAPPEPTVARIPVSEPREDRAKPQSETDEVVQPEPRPAAPVPRPTGAASPPTEGVRLTPSPRISTADNSQTDSSPAPRIFIGTATLASGDTLELGGIAWSETGPYALLDQRVVGLGERVMGYLVTRIAPHEVELEGDDGAILIRLE